MFPTRELVALATARFGLSDRAADRAVLGRWSGAYAAIASGLERPAVFGSVAATSLLARDSLDALQGRIAATEPTGVRFHLSWNRYERWEADALSRAVRDSLRSHGHTVGGGQRPESAGWSGFRAWAGAVLAELFPRLEWRPS